MDGGVEGPIRTLHADIARPPPAAHSSPLSVAAGTDGANRRGGGGGVAVGGGGAGAGDVHASGARQERRGTAAARAPRNHFASECIAADGDVPPLSSSSSSPVLTPL